MSPFATTTTVLLMVVSVDVLLRGPLKTKYIAISPSRTANAITIRVRLVIVINFFAFSIAQIIIAL